MILDEAAHIAPIADPDTLVALSGFIGSYNRTMTSHSTGYTSGN